MVLHRSVKIKKAFKMLRNEIFDTLRIDMIQSI